MQRKLDSCRDYAVRNNLYLDLNMEKPTKYTLKGWGTWGTDQLHASVDRTRTFRILGGRQGLFQL